MAAATVSKPSARSAVLDTAQLFRAECHDLEGLVEQLLGELEQSGTQIVAQAQALDAERLRTAQRERELAALRAQNERLAQRFERQEAQLETALAELRQMQEQLAAEPPAAPEMPNPGSQEWEQERSQLEGELNLVRRRAVELEETVTQQRLELSEQRQATTSELRQLREAFESQARRELRPATPAEVTELGSSREPNSPTEQEASHDPVIDSVMAQFAKLQKDVSQRRQRKK